MPDFFSKDFSQIETKLNNMDDINTTDSQSTIAEKSDFSGMPKIKVIGVGGAGGNAINDMIEQSIIGVEFVAINTDVQDLNISKADVKIQIGDKLTKGLGAGANPEIGKLAAEEDKEKIKKVLENTDMLFITAGMGGGTGTGAAPVISKIAKDSGILTIAVITKPFSFEGSKRKKNSDKGISELKEAVDSIVIIPNDKLLQLPDKKITLENAFKEANNVLKTGIKGITEVITAPGILNLDFADVETTMKNSGVAMLGFGEGTGENRVLEATEVALNNPLLEKSIKGSNMVLVNITGGKDLELQETSEIANIIIKASENENLDVMYGIITDESIEQKIKVTVIATKFEDDDTIERGEKQLTKSMIDLKLLDIPAIERRNDDNKKESDMENVSLDF